MPKLIVNARFLTQPVTGVQRYAIECGRQLKELHPDTVFVSPNNILHKDVAKELEATVVGSRTGHFWEQTDLVWYLSRQNNPPLLSPGNTGPVFYRNHYVVLHDLAFRHHPEWNSKAFSMWYNFMAPRLARNSRHIFTVSETIKKELCDAYAVTQGKISVTYNGISRRMMQMANEPMPAKDPIILSVGSFNRRKNHHVLVKAFLDSNIRRTHKLVIVGDKSKVFSESGLSETDLVNGNIEVLQNLAEAELISLYRRTQAVVSLSAYEGFGIPVLEGLYNGCIVICSDIPVYRELYDGHVSFCDSANLNSVISALDHIPEVRVVDHSALFARYSYTQAARTLLRQIK
jgi:glycosyltransferase involved in cell wall biosynthesis